MTRSKLVLPAPLRPTRPTFSRARIVKLTSSTSNRPATSTASPRTCNTGAMLTGMASTLERVRALQPRIRELEGEITDKRRLPTDLVEDLRGTGVFRMAMPKSWGGPELPLLDQLEIIEALSYANGSVGWCAMIGCDSGYYSDGSLDDAVGREVFALDSIVAGSHSQATTPRRWTAAIESPADGNSAAA